ncbi:MAG: hypothetical protein ACI906_004184, partial [Candidatus Latescibacterota bacterium]
HYIDPRRRCFSHPMHYLVNTLCRVGLAENMTRN